MRVPFRNVSAVLAVACMGAIATPAHAVPTFYTARPLFNADGRVTTTSTIDFDGLGAGTDLTGAILSGATFSAPGATPLAVILGATGVRNPMSPSSGTKVLSPGGSSVLAEDDDLLVTFATAVKAAGMDVVFDVPDGASYVGVAFLDSASLAICTSGFIPSPSGAPGYQFIGCVSDSANIKSIAFNEFDPTASDDHVAYDTLTFSPAYSAPPPPPPPGVPAPATALLLGAGVIGLGVVRRLRAP